jgi:hypothetical protein
MSTDSEIDRHLRAMLLMIDGMQCAHRGADWEPLRHMIWHAQTIARGIEDQRRDDADELEMQRRERDRLGAELETVKRLTHRDAERLNRLLVFVGRVCTILPTAGPGSLYEALVADQELTKEDKADAVQSWTSKLSKDDDQAQEAMQQMSQEAMRQMSNAGSGFGEVPACHDA